MDETEDDNYRPTAEGESIPSSVESDVDEKVQQTETGFMLQMSSKRGTDTRDEDAVKVWGKAESWAEIESKREPMREAVMREMAQLRGFQPDDDVLTEDEQAGLADMLVGAREAYHDGATTTGQDLLTDVIVELTGEVPDPPEGH